MILKQCPHLHDVAGVLGAGSEDAVTRGKWEGVKGHVPGASRVLNEGELIEFAAQQFRRRPVEALDRRVLALLRLVAADLRLEREVIPGGVEHRPRHQRRTGIVEVEHPLTSRCLPPRPRHVERHSVLPLTHVEIAVVVSQMLPPPTA